MDDRLLATAVSAERRRTVDQPLPRLRRAEAELQWIAQEAADLAGTAYAAVSVIDRMRQWLVSPDGPIRVLPRSIAMCAHAMHRPGEATVVPDTTRDLRFADNPFVTSAPFIRFYVGIPLVDRAGYAIGTLCVADGVSRDTMPDLYLLAALARRAERIVVS